MNKSTQRKIREKTKSTSRKRNRETEKPKGFESAPEPHPWERRTRIPMEVDLAEIFLGAPQRDVKPNQKKIKNEFELARFDRPVINIRRPMEQLLPGTNAYLWESQQPMDAKYALTDGKQRIAAWREIYEEGELPKTVLVDSIQASFGYEEWYFKHQDRFKARLDKGDFYSSGLTSDDQKIVIIDKIVRKHGFYVPNKMTKKADQDIRISSPSGPIETFEFDNEGVILDRALSIIANCWSSYDNAGHHDVIKGVGRLIRGYGSKITPEVEARWRQQVQVGSLLEAAQQGTSQSERSEKVATKLRNAVKITKKPNLNY